MALIFLLSALPAFGAAWFTKRGGDVLVDALRPISGHKFPLDEAWPRGVQEEEPRPWGAIVSAAGPPTADADLVPTSGDERLPELQRVTRSVAAARSRVREGASPPIRQP